MAEENEGTDQKAGAGNPKPDPAKGDGEPLGAEGMKALQSERALRAAAEKKAEDAAAERDALKAQHQTEAEKAIEKAKQEGRNEAALEANRRIAKSEARAAAGGKVVDIDDAIQLLGDLDRFIVKGEVDSKAISAAIADLVKAKPYLASAGSKAKPLPGGGATQSSGSSFNDTLRAKIRRQ